MIPDSTLARARAATTEDPFRLVSSACMMGEAVGFDGNAYPHGLVQRIAALDNVTVLPFCPENFALGTPRVWMAIHGGDGGDVVDGRARIIDKSGVDVTEGFVEGGREMVRLATDHRAELAVLMETSPSCSVHVIHRGEQWPETEYRQGTGSTTAFLTRAGIPCVSSRDARSLGRLAACLDPTFETDPAAIDAVESEWYREYFG